MHLLALRAVTTTLVVQKEKRTLYYAKSIKCCYRRKKVVFYSCNCRNNFEFVCAVKRLMVFDETKQSITNCFVSFRFVNYQLFRFVSFRRIP